MLFFGVTPTRLRFIVNFVNFQVGLALILHKEDLLIGLTVVLYKKPQSILIRLALRSYFTYTNWSDSFVGQVATGSFAIQAHGTSMGLQMEVWW